ncbi:ankyrin, partial [Athelia psychrophila]
MLQEIGSKRAGEALISDRPLKIQRPRPGTSMLRAMSLDLQLSDDVAKPSKFTNPDHFAVLYIDEVPVPTVGNHTFMPAPRWPSFDFDIASAVKIAIFRSGEIEKNIVVAQYQGQGRDFMARDTRYELTDGSGSPMDLCLSVNVHLMSHPPDCDSAREGQTFNTVGTSGPVNNVGGDLVVHGDYNVYQEPKSAIQTSARVEGIQDVQMEENIEKWMDAPDTSPNFNAARKKHTPDTGSWFLEGSEFTRWKEYPDILLWLNGGPGCGKTVLCAAAIQAIIDFCDSKASTGYAYFFFDGRSAEAALLVHDKFMRSIVMQLAHRCDGIPVALAEMYRKCDKGFRRPPIDLLEATFLRILDSFNDVYIAIDSLDECSERPEVILWIQSMASKASGKLHMVMSSRPESEIMQGLRELSQLKEICISGHQTEPDIRSFLNTRLSQRDAAKWTNAQKDMIKEALTDGADGMFRWVALQADRLIKCASLQDLKQRLKSLPQDLNESYARTLSESPDPGNLKKLLQWLAYSTRAMTIEEIAEVAVVDFGDDESMLPVYDADRRFADPDHVFTLCYGLITEVEDQMNRTDPRLERIKLAHYSVKEYLISSHILSGAAAGFRTDEQLSHSIIAQTSLAYLLHFDKPGALSVESVPSFPLAQYAAEHWVAHCHRAGSDQGNTAVLQQLQLNFFEPSPSYAIHNCLFVYDKEDYGDFGFFRRAEDLPSPFYYACRSGLTTVAAHLISQGADVNGNHEYLGPPLTVASDQGHLKTIQLLLVHGADVDAVGGEYSGTALQEAASRGRIEIVELLLAHSADVNAAEGRWEKTALLGSSENGHLAVVELLLA